MIRGYLIKLLFYLIDTASDVDTNDQMDKWLADNWGHPGFRAYVAQRDAKIVRNLAGGDQLVTSEPKKAWQMTGQRVEILVLGRNAKKAFIEREQKKKKK